MVSKRIQEARKSTGQSQEEFAKRMNVHRVTLSDYERGVQAPSIETVEQIAKLTDRPVAWFFLENGQALGSTEPSAEKALDIIATAVRRVGEAESNLVQLSAAVRAANPAATWPPEIQAILEKYPGNDPQRDRVAAWESSRMPPLQAHTEKAPRAARDKKRRK